MKTKFNLNSIQKLIRTHDLNGWVFYDYRGIDKISVQLLGIDSCCRRWFYFIPAQGAAFKFVHAAEHHILDHVPGKKIVYRGWEELTSELRASLGGQKKIAAQYSPECQLPDISLMDAGTFELLTSLNIGLVSSAELVQILHTQWSEAQLNMHVSAAGEIYETIQKTMRWMKKQINDHQQVTELTTQAFLLKEIDKRGLQTEMNPLVAAGRNSGVPYYTPAPEQDAAVLPGQIVQIYVAAKEKNPHAVYATLAWIAYTGRTVPDEINKIFTVLVTARDKAIQFLDAHKKSPGTLSGFEIDNVIQDVMRSAGYENYRLHRSGFSLGMDMNVAGITIDNLEVKDTRKIIPRICFSLEPALYFAEYGLRTSANVYIAKTGPQVQPTKLQTEIHRVMR